MGDQKNDSTNVISGEPKSKEDPQSTQDNKSKSSDSLAGWAIWAVVFAILSITIVGGAIGGVIACFISFPITKVLPIRPDGRKLPVTISIALFVAAIIIFIIGT